MSQEQVAQTLCTDASNYSRKERGEIKISEREWMKLSEFFKVSINEIKESFSNKDSSRISNDYSDLLKDYNVLNSIVGNLQEFILVLKEERSRLKTENENLQIQLAQLKK